MTDAFKEAEEYILRKGLRLEPKKSGRTEYNGHTLYKYMYIVPARSGGYYVRVRNLHGNKIPTRSFKLTKPESKHYPNHADDIYNSTVADEAFRAGKDYITQSGLALEPKQDRYYASYRGHTLYKGMRIDRKKTHGGHYIYLVVAPEGRLPRTFKLGPTRSSSSATTTAAAETELLRRHHRRKAVPVRSSNF